MNEDDHFLPALLRDNKEQATELKGFVVEMYDEFNRHMKEANLQNRSTIKSQMDYFTSLSQGYDCLYAILDHHDHLSSLKNRVKLSDDEKESYLFLRFAKLEIIQFFYKKHDFMKDFSCTHDTFSYNFRVALAGYFEHLIDKVSCWEKNLTKKLVLSCD